jgi:hypothetical protein
MKTMSAKDAKNGLGLLLDTARERFSGRVMRGLAAGVGCRLSKQDRSWGYALQAAESDPKRATQKRATQLINN